MPGPQDTLHVRVDLLESELAALKAKLADYKSLVRVAIVELIEMVKAERG